MHYRSFIFKPGCCCLLVIGLYFSILIGEISSMYIYQKIIKACENCINISIKRFSSGDAFHSNPKSQMGTWIPSEQMSELITVLSDVTTNHNSNMIKTIRNSQLPIIACLVKSNEFDLNIIKAPVNYTIASRTHTAGTILLYKNLDGEGLVHSMIGKRVIQTDVMNANTDILRRMGGPSRSISACAQTPCLMIELAIHPPKASSENYIGGHGVYIDADSSMENNDAIMLNIPNAYLSTIFSSRNISTLMNNASDGKIHSQKNVSSFSTIRKQLDQNIGGLSTELDNLVRRIILTRMLSTTNASSSVLSHVKGLLLYGKPGTGKTLIAREFARNLNASSIQIVNGPEIMDKFVGEAERNIRNLFTNAEDDWKLYKENSGLHVIIFDEIDAIAKPRGSLIGDGSGVRDSVVNQLLSKIDGIQEVDNILVIGLTNRKDLIDPALLRAGRLEVHIEIKAPDDIGREEILSILFRPLVNSKTIELVDAVRLSGFLAQDKYTFSWTGAELSGLVRSANSFALNRYFENITTKEEDSESTYKIEIADVISAYEEVSKSISTEKKKDRVLSKLSTLKQNILSVFKTKSDKESMFNLYKSFHFNPKENILEIIQTSNTFDN